MRHLRFLTLCLIVLFSCSRENLTVPENGASGEVEIRLAVSDTETDIRPQTKAAEENVPVLDDFIVEIYNSKGIRIYRASYQEAVAAEKGLLLTVNSGEYRLLAQCRDSAAIGFDPAIHAWYAADSTFTVGPQEKKTISATAKMMKVKVKVNHGANLVQDYPEHYSVVKLIKGKTSAGELKFSKTETKSGYIPAGKLVYELYVTDPDTQQLRYFHGDTTQYNPNDFVTFNVDVVRGNGQTGNVTVKVDESCNGINKEYEIPSSVAPKDAPSITFDGFTPEKVFSFVEGVEYPGVQVNIAAMGKIKSFEISSQFLTNKGITASAEEALDLASATLDPAKAEALRALGFNWGRSVAGNRLAVIDFESIGLKNAYDPALVFSGEFTLKVTDEIGKTATETFTLTQKSVNIGFNPQQYNAFAKRISGISATIGDANPDKAVLQYSTDGVSWIPVSKASATPEGEVKYNDITGLEPEKIYKLRVIYNGNENVVSPIAELTTEAASQLGNAGFEEWTTKVYNYKTTFSSGTCDWYLPYSSPESSWWAVNSLKTMRSWCSSGTPGVGDNFNIKVFPTVSYYNEGGRKSVQLATIETGKSATNNSAGGVEVTKAAGEIWIGTAKYEGDWSNGGGDHLTDGHSFNSRPSAVSFYYQYFPYENETFYVKIEFKDKDGVSFYSKEITDGPAESTGKVMTVPIEYSDNTKKAATIFISFKSSSASDPGCHKTNITMPNGDQTALVGSVLRIDDIKLIYE